MTQPDPLFGHTRSCCGIDPPTAACSVLAPCSGALAVSRAFPSSTRSMNLEARPGNIANFKPDLPVISLQRRERLSSTPACSAAPARRRSFSPLPDQPGKVDGTRTFVRGARPVNSTCGTAAHHAKILEPKAERRTFTPPAPPPRDGGLLLRHILVADEQAPHSR